MPEVLVIGVILLSCRPAAPLPPPPASVPLQPEAATGCRDGIDAVQSTGGLVVSAHPESTRIGAEILASGGSAVDAAAAVAVALTLVEPQSSGIGGGAFLLHYRAATGEVVAWDGRETAPRGASGDLFVVDGAVQSFPDAVPGGLSVGTPGLVRMLEAVHAESGSLPWADLFAPTIALARAGFVVTPRMSRSIVQWEDRIDPLRTHPVSNAYFYPDGVPLAAGVRRDNPALAETLTTIAEGGADAFYTGPLAEAIVAAVQGASRNPGGLALADLAAYAPVRRGALCLQTHGHTVCGHPPPTSGGTTVLSILGLMEGTSGAVDSAQWVHRFAESVRLAWADRGRYVADPAYVDVPTAAMLDPAYLASRRSLVADDARMTEVIPGELPVAEVSAPACPEGQDTTHLVVVDARGDVVTLTSSIENAWGSGTMVGGFLLNNQLTDFARDPTGDPANAVAACKRPRSSMSPTLVLSEDGEPVMAVGSPGGSRIIQYTARVILDVLGEGTALQAAIARPNLAQTPRGIELEDDCGVPAWSEATVAGLEALGHDVVRGSLNSGLHGIQRVDGVWVSGVDPRREGHAIAVPAIAVPAP